MPNKHFLPFRRKSPLVDEPGSPPRQRSERAKRRRTRLLIGGLVALPLGAALGYLARLDPETFRTAGPVAAVPGMPLVVEVRRSEATAMAAPTPVTQSPETPLPNSPDFALPPPPPPLPPLPPPRRQITAAPPPVLEGARVTPEARPPRPSVQGVSPSFNCRFAQSSAEQMVCGDPELAAADRRLANAFEQAIAAGVSRRALRGEQDDWLQIREDAARESPRAVRQVYEQRIAELLAIARDPN